MQAEVKKFWFAGIQITPNSYYLCMSNESLPSLGKTDGAHDSDNTEKLKWKYKITL